MSTRKPQVKHNVFVYGTLRPVDRTTRTPLPATYLLYDYKMFDAGKFPYIKFDEHSDSHQSVKGNIIEVSSKDLKALDNYEGVNRGLYERRRVMVESIDMSGTEVEVWVYVAGPALAPQSIASGDWFAR